LSGVGKSNIVLRFVKDTFAEDFGASIGGSFMGKLITFNNTPIKFKVCQSFYERRYGNILIDMGYGWRRKIQIFSSNVL